MSKELMTKYRTTIIENFIKIEGYVTAIICKHYFGRLTKDIMLEVFGDELCNTGFKANLLEKVFSNYPEVKKPREYADKFRQMARIRNHFAHCNSTVSLTPFKESSFGVPDPRKPNKYLNIEQIIKKFSELDKTMSEKLVDFMDKMGLHFIQDTDKEVLSLIFEDPKK